MYLGIDIGTSAIKAALIEGDGVSRFTKRYPPDVNGGEHDPDLVAETFANLVREIGAAHSRNWSHLRGICLSGHGPSLIIVDDAGTPKTPIITWQDTRARSEEEAIAAHYPGFNRGGSSFEGKFNWLVNNRPGLFEQPCTALYPKDYLLRRLGGEAVMDRSTASTIVWYDRENECWKNDQSAPSAMFLPRVIDSWEQIGVTSGVWSKSCGLPPNVPLFAGGIDAYCETVGVGAIQAGDLVDGSGTSTCISVCLALHAQGDLHVIPGKSLKMETMSSTGSSVDWFLQLTGEDMHFFDQAEPYSPVPLLFLPYLTGERSPIWNERAKGALVGLRTSSDKKETALAVLQGCAFGIRQNIELLELHSGSSSFEVLAAGGGARNDVWMKIKADVTGKRYLKPEIVDASALGAAMIAALGRDKIQPEDACQRWVRIEKTFEPSDDEKTKRRCDTLYSLYVDLYPRLQETFWKLSSIE